MTHHRLLAGLILAILASPALAGGDDPVQAHVASIADGLAPHLPRGGAPPPVEVIGHAMPVAGIGQDSGSIVVSTGLLSMLRSDAQLAMVVAYEQCRALPREDRRGDRQGGYSAGAQIGRAVAVGAVGGLVADVVWDAVDHGGSAAEYALTGAAVAGTVAAVDIALRPRRHDRPAADDDNLAAKDGMSALVSAGWDGEEALAAWDAISQGVKVPVDDGGYADPDANAKRRSAAGKALKKSGQKSSPRAGYGVGGDSYRQAVLLPLQSEAVAGAAPAAPPPPAAPAVARDSLLPPLDPATTWLVYRRSGGFTGWSAELRVNDDGTRWVLESQARDTAGPRPALAPEQLQALQDDVTAALKRPPRQATKQGGMLRDGMVRSIDVRTDYGWKSVALSDGLALSDEDHRLVQALERALK